MAVTRANVEVNLIRRLGPLMTKAGMDGSTADGTNTDLADPIAWALRQAGYTTADITNPTTAEVAAAESDIDQVQDLSEMRTLENILGGLDDVDISVGPRDEKLSQLAAQAEKKLAAINEKLENLYSWSASPLTTGTLTYEFAEHQDGSQDDV
ncbi:MAG: hypothetical protein KAJ73_01050 [Zetaproteobacteria bacterium]|nr:hypothetical protein [Zetaproteobacteria bacterium]